MPTFFATNKFTENSKKIQLGFYAFLTVKLVYDHGQIIFTFHFGAQRIEMPLK